MLRESDRRRIQEVRAILGTVCSEHRSVLPDLLPLLRDTLKAERIMALGIGGDAAGLWCEFVEANGFPIRQLRTALDSFLPEAPAGWAAWNPTRPARRDRNRPVSVFSEFGREAVERMAIYQRVLAPIGVRGHDQLRCIITDGASLLAWVGGFRPDPFSFMERDIFRHVTPALRARLKLERLLWDGHVATEALDAALEHVAAHAFVVNAQGRVRHANTAGVAAFAADPRGLLAAIRQAIQRGQGVTACTWIAHRSGSLIGSIS